MGKIDVFTVVFAGNKSVYYPGEVLNGAVILKLNKELKLRELKIEFHGEARVRWSQSSGSGNNRRTHTYHNSEVYINTCATLFGKAPGAKDSPVLQPGEYNYPFQFHIPPNNLPSSFEGQHGHIRYWLKAVIDRPWRFDVTTKVAFSMIEIVDINLNNLVCPLQQETSEQLGSLCCVAGRLEIISATDRGGYCPGELINASLYITNNSSQDLPGIELSLHQTTTFIASTGRTRQTKNTVQQVQHEGVQRGNDGHFPSIAVAIPAVPPTMSSCKCIKINYDLKIKIRVSGCHSNCKLKFPVVVGSVPYYRPPLPPVQPMQYHQPALQPSAPMLPMGEEASPSGMNTALPAYSPSAPNPQDQPPSYAQCMFGGASIRDDADGQGAMGNMNFVPVYPFVNNYQIPPPQAANAPVPAYKS
ncbi:arrestin domain-containing protein 3 [Exaiptasia diaphana]|uniref:Arrestin C-terminal-like domain-containing protein n=1 Tax=Exaiptasia diaphana TaxID=2652724 RepID=A0A913X1U0_EXADI|nr:arrestin domain-containing protein 3 [Exaiptasia diaphana]KXJ16020.1 Arrestin domain-containing protein 3 [Exaiptasia diaphana]